MQKVPSKQELDRVFREGQKILRQQQLAQAQNKACYLEIEHAYAPFRDKLVRNALVDILRGLKDLRWDLDYPVKITSQAMFYTRENDWYRVIQVNKA